jgi:hypothetical protein
MLAIGDDTGSKGGGGGVWPNTGTGGVPAEGRRGVIGRRRRPEQARQGRRREGGRACKWGSLRRSVGAVQFATRALQCCHVDTAPSSWCEDAVWHGRPEISDGHACGSGDFVRYCSSSKSDPPDSSDGPLI